MPSLNPYLNFNGNAEEAFNFYQTVFQTEIQFVMRFNDAPPPHQGSENEKDKIMHISLAIGNGSLLMGSDVPEAMGKVTMGDNFCISITTDSKEETDRLFDGLLEGGQVLMPLELAFWGSYFGMLKDKFEINWMLSFDRGS